MKLEPKSKNKLEIGNWKLEVTRRTEAAFKSQIVTRSIHGYSSLLCTCSYEIIERNFNFSQVNRFHVQIFAAIPMPLLPSFFSSHGSADLIS